MLMRGTTSKYRGIYKFKKIPFVYQEAKYIYDKI